MKSQSNYRNALQEIICYQPATDDTRTLGGRVGKDAWRADGPQNSFHGTFVPEAAGPPIAPEVIRGLV